MARRVAPASKLCADCGTRFEWPEWASRRQWFGLDCCEPCFEERVRQRILANSVVDSNGCRIWQRGLKNGYGVMSIRDTPQYVHVVAFRLWKGPMPEGKETCHSCDVRRCNNPDHLFAGPHLERMARSAIPPEAETIVLFKDGAAWLAVRPDFQDIQASPTGSGKTPGEAVEDLLREERRAKRVGSSATG